MEEEVKEEVEVKVEEAKEQKKPKATKVEKNEETVIVSSVKYNKLVSGAKKALAQYRTAHKELTYPGFKELEEGLS